MVTQTHLALSSQTPAVAADETFDGTWPFKARYTDAPGFAMHYVEEGGGFETLLLLHGEPTWGYLFRQQIPVWSQHARVIALDHMGFGKSATPQDRTYWLQDQIDNLEAFVLALDLCDVTLIMHDFGGPVGMGLAARHPQRIRRIVSINGPTPFGQSALVDRVTANAGVSPWFQWILQAEKNGIIEEVLGHLNFNILSTLKLNGFVRNEIVTDSWIRAYRAPFPTPAHAAGAIGWAKGFATGKHKFETPDATSQAMISAKPALAIWGEQDRTLHSDHFLPLFRQLFPTAPIHRFVANDPDVNIDFDDAIQVSSLCGGRIDEDRDVFSFSSHRGGGVTWTFEVNRVQLNAIADGSFRALSVHVSQPE